MRQSATKQNRAAQFPVQKHTHTHTHMYTHFDVPIFLSARYGSLVLPSIDFSFTSYVIFISSLSVISSSFAYVIVYDYAVYLTRVLVQL